MQQERINIRIALLALLIVAFAPIAHAAVPATSSKKFDFLLHFYDLNEEAFAYYRHCLSRDGKINDAFMKNLDYVANELLEQTLAERPGVNPDMIRTKILERRFNLQYGFDNANINDGCGSPASQAARVHYEEFSRFTPDQVSKFIEDKTAPKTIE